MLYHTYANAGASPTAHRFRLRRRYQHEDLHPISPSPNKPVTADTLPPPCAIRLAAACTLLGISDPIALADCILDVANTGQQALPFDAQRIQVINPSRGMWHRRPCAKRDCHDRGKATFSFTGTAGTHAYVEVTATSLPTAVT
jgi:hypothetical protein